MPCNMFEPEFIAKFASFFQTLTSKLEVKVWNGMKFTGKIVGSLIFNLVESLNANQMLELDFAWKQMIENEFCQLNKLYIMKVKSKFKELESKLPLATYEISEEIDSIKDTIYDVMKEEICQKN